MLKQPFIALFAAWIASGSSAQSSPNDLGMMVDNYIRQSAECTASGDYEGEECRKEFASARRLIDRGWCRQRSREIALVRCSIYKRYVAATRLAGPRLGFESWGGRESFSIILESSIPTLEGALVKESIGKLTIFCEVNERPFVVVEIENDYPEFAVRADKTNFFAILEGDGWSGLTGALLSEKSEKAEIFFLGREIVLEILRYFATDPLNSKSEPKTHTLRFSSFEPKATLDLEIMPVFYNFDAMRYRVELQELLNNFTEMCASSLE